MLTPPTDERARPSLFVPLLVALCIALAGVDVALVLRNRELESRLGEASRLLASHQRAREEMLEGAPFPALTLLDAEGSPVDLTGPTGAGGVLLFVSSPLCDHCEMAQPAWRRAADALTGTPVRVFELVLDVAPKRLADGEGPIAHLAAGEAGPVLARRLPGVPIAVFLDPSGTVWRTVQGGEQIGLERAAREFLDRLLRMPGDG